MWDEVGHTPESRLPGTGAVGTWCPALSASTPGTMKRAVLPIAWGVEKTYPVAREWPREKRKELAEKGAPKACITWK